MRFIFAGLCLLLSFPASAQQKKPNIVLILADDLGIGDIGTYGQKIIQTPNIDRLAAGGLKFTQFYSGTSVCAPSRSALLTGQHTGHTYIRGNKEIMPEGQEPLADSVQTLAMLLKSAGYTTGAFGKWGLGMTGTTGDPNRKGFDEFFGYNCQRQSHRYYPTHLWHNNREVPLEGNDLTNKVLYAPALIQEKTLEFVEKNQNKPFFLFIPTVLPHAELTGPEDEFYRKYENRFEETVYKGNDYGPEATVPGYASVPKPRATYAAMVERMDHYVGEVVQKLTELNLLDNTLIIFTSDNGAHSEGGADPAFFNSTAGFRGQKRDLYEGGVRAPFIAHWPKQIRQARVTDHIAAFWDLLPTFTDLARAPSARYTDGLSLLPTLTGKGRQARHTYLYWEFHEGGGRQAVRSGKWKLVKLQVKTTEKTTYELYNLETDPGETRNLINKKSSVYKKLQKYIEEAHAESTLFPLYLMEGR
ncbi:arylsulfatase [Leadbetterella sp. DM7]|uniref:arylsulfatase n=1 Tax=Leadbetterella sp. DM7 TaxID=3235085 RepID=UPI00349E5AAC